MNLNQNTSELQKLDSKHFLHPFTDPKALQKKGARVITRAEGIYLWDSDGEKILDGMAGLWCVNVGYGRENLLVLLSNRCKNCPITTAFSIPPIRLLLHWLKNYRRLLQRGWIKFFSQIPDQSPMIPCWEQLEDFGVYWDILKKEYLSAVWKHITEVLL